MASTSEHQKQAINAAMELLHKRWMMRVIWEMRGGPLTFRALQSACGDLSPTVLNQRLGELREVRLVTSDEMGYQLTPIGRDLLEAFAPLSKWAVRWHRSKP
jgi:DNA-binding HxlR family transcriptional regulator